MSLEEFIVYIKSLPQTNPSLFASIKHPALLLGALGSLTEMVGVLPIKKEIIQLVKWLMLGKCHSPRELHSVFLAKAGMGKERLAKIIATIYTSFDLLTKPPIIPSDGDEREKEKKRLSELDRRIVDQRCQTAVFIGELELHRNRIMEQNLAPADMNHFLTTARGIKRGLDEINVVDPPTASPSSGVTPISTSGVNLVPPTPATPSPGNEVKLSPNSEATPSPGGKVNLSLGSDDPPPPVSPPVIYKACTRADFLAIYASATGIKTRKLLNSVLGGVLYIREDFLFTEEASTDSNIGECLRVILEYITLYSAHIAIFFSSQEKEIKLGRSKSQRGLKSHLGYVYPIKEYTPEEVSTIFTLQLRKNNWLLDCERETLVSLFTANDRLLNNGHATEELILHCSNIYVDHSFLSLSQNRENIVKNGQKIVKDENFKLAVKTMATVRGMLYEEELPPPHGMYT